MVKYLYPGDSVQHLGRIYEFRYHHYQMFTGEYEIWVARVIMPWAPRDDKEMKELKRGDVWFLEFADGSKAMSYYLQPTCKLNDWSGSKHVSPPAMPEGRRQPTIDLVVPDAMTVMGRVCELVDVSDDSGQQPFTARVVMPWAPRATPEEIRASRGGQWFLEQPDGTHTMAGPLQLLRVLESEEEAAYMGPWNQVSYTEAAIRSRHLSRLAGLAGVAWGHRTEPASRDLS